MMTMRILVGVLLVISVTVGSDKNSVDGAEPKVLMIGIDGLRSDALKAAKTPHLDRLIERGVVDYQTSVVSPDVTSSDTVSGPGWTTFLTGTWADKHGVIDNRFTGRDQQAAPHCFQLIKKAKPELRTVSLVTWIPINEFITTDADVLVGVLAPKESGTSDYAAADARVATMAEDLLVNDPADAFVAYFGAVDETGHAHGFHPSVQPYVKMIETVDSHIGRLSAAIDARSTDADNPEDWLIIVSTDHGGEGTGHHGGRNNPVVRTVPMIVSGDRAAKSGSPGRPTATVDVVAVAMEHLEIRGDAVKHLEGSSQGWLSERPRRSQTENAAQ